MKSFRTGEQLVILIHSVTSLTQSLLLNMSSFLEFRGPYILILRASTKVAMNESRWACNKL